MFALQEKVTSAAPAMMDETLPDAPVIETEESDESEVKGTLEVNGKVGIKTNWKERMRGRFFWRVEIPVRIYHVSRPCDYEYSASITASERAEWTKQQIWDLIYWRDRNSREIWSWLNKIPEHCHRVLSKRKYDDYLEHGQMNEFVHRLPQRHVHGKPNNNGTTATLDEIETEFGREYNEDHAFYDTKKRFGCLEPLTYMVWPASEVYGRKRAHSI